MPASFEKEALKAQAIAVRSYTYKKLETKEYEFLGKDNLIWINDPLKRELIEILGKDNVVVQN